MNNFTVSNVRREDIETFPTVQFTVTCNGKTLDSYEWLNVNDDSVEIERTDSATKTNNNGLSDFCRENDIDEFDILNAVEEKFNAY